MLDKQLFFKEEESSEYMSTRTKYTMITCHTHKVGYMVKKITYV